MSEDFRGLYKEYMTRCQQESDINELLPFLYAQAMQCEHITEMGFRGGNSAVALLAGLENNRSKNKIFHTYDLDESVQVMELRELAEKDGVIFHFHQEDVLLAEIEETDFLFIDTEHTYFQVTNELNRHSEKARKWIGFHDVATFPDLDRGISDWMRRNKNWKIVLREEQNNGLMIIERIK